MTSKNEEKVVQISKKESRQRMAPQVLFTEIPDCYSTGHDITVSYELNGNWKPSSSDWIGLFLNDTDDPANYKTYEYSRPSTCSLDNKSLSLKVTFKACYLPQSGAEKYRFCYVTKQGNIRGKSTEFVFTKTIEECTSDSDSDIVVIDQGYGDFDQMQAELDEIKRENFTLRSHLENKEEETATLANLLTSAEAQIELLYGALQKHEESNQKAKEQISKREEKLEGELIELQRKLVASEETNYCMENEIRNLRESASSMEEKLYRRMHEIESDRNCLQAELTHLEEATATSRFREAELKKAIETAQDTTRALISENNERRGHEEALLLAEEQIEKLTKDLFLSEQIRMELEAKYMHFDTPRSRTSSNVDQYMDSSIERIDNYKTSTERSHEMEHETSDTDASSSSINVKPSSNASSREHKKFLPTAFDRLVKAVLK